MTPTLVASRTALPPEGALRLRPGEAVDVAPTLPTACGSLPPKGAPRLRPGKAGSAAPAGVEESSASLVALHRAQPARGTDLDSGGPAHSSHFQGLFISFEGIDGAGKSTHIDALASAFRSAGRVVTLTREPGGTLLAEKLRSLVLEEAMDPLTESLLIFAARRDHLVRVIAPALLRGDVVLCDRFTDATFAYQGAGRGFDLGVLAMLERWVQADEGLLGDPAGNQPMKPGVETVIEPDLTVWFDLPPEEAALRLAGSRVPDRFESQPVEFFRRVAQGYAQRQRDHVERFARIDASLARDAVWQCVLQAVIEKGWLQATARP